MHVTPFTIEVPDAVLDDLYRHYKAMVDGLGSHFIHEKGKGPNPLPLVITHGWPGHSSRCTSSSRHGPE